MTFAIIQLFVFQVVLPAIFIISLWKINVKNRLDWMIQLLFTLTFIVWITLTGPWDWFGIYFRYLWLIIAMPVIYISWKRVRLLPFRTKLTGSGKFLRGINIVLFLVFALYTISAFNGMTVKEEAIELSFPLKNGTYYVGQGGSTTQMNYHNSYEPQSYAIDIVKLNYFGARADDIYPDDLEKYEIFGDILYCPCNGTVLETRDHLKDLTPPDSNPDQPEGNYLAIQCDGSDATLYIAHMKEGSITVAENDTVAEGYPIGLVGNSGNTTEPHLHIHVEKDGIGIPIRFDGNFLVRNNIVK